VEQGPREQSPEGAGAAPDAEPQIMSKLPRTRPQRRSDRRRATGGRRATAGRSGAAKRGAARTQARAQPASRGRSRAGARGTQARARRSRTLRQRAPGMPELALGAAVEMAKLPLRVTAALSRETARLIRRGLRIR
jgi:hypothetical protein